MWGNYVTSLPNDPVLHVNAVNKSYVDAADNLRQKLDGSALMTSGLNLRNKVSNVVNPTKNTNGVSKKYIDNEIGKVLNALDLLYEIVGKPKSSKLQPIKCSRWHF